jgi:molybdopterin-containing oxidoreductase family membrane subunit
MLYFSVLLLEVLPIVASADWWLTRRFPKLARQVVRLHSLAPILAVAGLALSALHQSSLGATYGVLKARPIWYRPDLSVLFMISAIAGGQAITLFITMLAGRLTPRARVDDGLVSRVAHFIGWVVLVYLYFRFWDALSMTYTYLPGRTEGLHWLTQGPFAFNFWVGEILLGAVVPIVVLLNGRLRRIPWLRMVALALVALGVVAYRWDINLVGQLVLLGYLPTDITARYTSYVPSAIELISSAGIVAYGSLAVTLGIRYLNVVDHRASAHAHAPVPAPVAAPAALAPAGTD